MDKVNCRIEYINVSSGISRKVPGVKVTCTKCYHSTESVGCGNRSIKRCLAMLREQCPKKEKNFYVD